MIAEISALLYAFSIFLSTDNSGSVTVEMTAIAMAIRKLAAEIPKKAVS